MKSRFVITVLCVGAVAFACGPRARSDASSSSTGTTTLASARTVAQQGTARTTRTAMTAAKGSPISAALDVRTEGAAIHFELQVENTGKKSIELNFPSGQTHDFVILDTLGNEVWRWARGRLFTQALQNRMLSRGERLSLTERWDSATLKAGRYTAVAVLKSENYPITQRTEFEIGGARLAVRD